MTEDPTHIDPVALAETIRQELTGPGGPWETAITDVLGEQLLVFTNRHRSVRDMFLADSAEIERELLVLGDLRLTCGEVRARVAATAQRMASEHGIGHGDRVAILAANRPEWVIAFYATLSLGAIAAALNGWWTASEIDQGLELAEPSLLVGDSKRLARVDNMPAGLAVQDMDINPDFFGPDGSSVMPETPIDEDDPALILFTSGTTGRSKDALVSHRGLVSFVDGTIYNGTEKKLTALRAMGIDPDTLPATREISLNTSPLFHVSGLLAGILMHLRSGSTIIFREGRFDPADVLRLIEEERVTSWSAIGSMAPRVLAHRDLATRDTTSLVRLGSGGAHLPEHLQDAIRENLPQAGASVGQGYGSSESVGVITSIGGQAFRDNPTSAGGPCLGFEIEIRDEADNVLPDGVEGEVHVRSCATMLGYWGNPEATEATIKAGRWLAMGDIGRMQDGMLFLNSRARDMILRAGDNIYPVEIEHRLEAHPDVAEAAVIGVDHHDLGQEVKAIVVPTAGRFDSDVLATWCSETLAAYKVPAHWQRRDEPLPRNASGKVVKGVLTGERELSDHDD